MSEYLSWHAPPRRRPVAEVAVQASAALFRAASASLDRLAHRLEARRAPSLGGVVEFHAESGAPEGALYIDGRLVGWIDGVNRL
jgi:hypothetical protein